MNDCATKAVPPVILKSGTLTATLILGDCRIIAPMLDGVDAVISDPPYGMNWDTDSTRFSGGTSANINRKPTGEGRADWGDIGGDAEPFDPSLWLDYERCVLFGANHYAQRLPVGTTLVWLKRSDHLFQSFLSDAEVAWMKGGHGVYAFRKQFPAPLRMKEFNGGSPRPAHPTQKPISVMRWVMDMATVPPFATVLDPYMGSGTTGIACLRTGRNFIGIERDPAHFATAVSRIEHEIAQGEPLC